MLRNIFNLILFLGCVTLFLTCFFLTFVIHLCYLVSGLAEEAIERMSTAISTAVRLVKD